MSKSRNRKIAYILSIFVLFTAIIGMGKFIEKSADENKLTQQSLGKVNPVSGTAQLVFVGLRGIAVTFLWHDAIELKKKERWFEIKPVLNSITLLQPNFIKPWTFQAWNMAYNIAAEWESVPDKYYWMREGIDFMKNAVDNNRHNSDLVWYVGWLYFNRFGTSDEKTYLRELFKKETDQQFSVSKDGIKDSFMVSYDWFVKANDVAREIFAEYGQRPKERGVTPFMSYPATAKTSYADFMGKEGVFGENAKNAWRRAYQEWIDFGREGGLDKEKSLRFKLEFTPEEFKALKPEQRFWSEHYAKIVNYYYWKKRTNSEASDELQAAREAFYKATAAEANADYKEAIAQYEKAFPGWRKMLESDENLKNDGIFMEDSQIYEMKYLRLLSRLGLKRPAKRPFDGLYAEYIPEVRGGGDLIRSKPNVGTLQPQTPQSQ